MIAALKAWWHNRRYADCQVCGREFRKGSGGGVSGEIFCSGWCYGVNLGQWLALIGGVR